MRVVLGCGNFGGIGSAPAFFGQGETKEQAFELMDAAWELGLRRFDTADAYGGGRSEQWIGDWLRETGNRPRVTTKTFNAMEEGADHGPRARARAAPGGDEPRAARRRADRPLPDARARPGHAGRGDVRGVRGAPRARRDRRPGACRTSTWTISASGSSSGTPALVQNSYSLLDRGDEAEVIPLCAEHGIEYQAFSPLAGGWLTGKYRRGEALPEGSRMTMRPEPYRAPRDRRDLRRRSRRSSGRRPSCGVSYRRARARLGARQRRLGRHRPAAAGAPRAGARGALAGALRRPSATK